MAGTLVISDLSDGTNSTSATNAIKGSAKAWVNFNGVTTATIRSSYNVSSVTRNGTGDYTVNFATAFASANYSAVATAVNSASGNTNTISCGIYAPSTAGVGAVSLTTSSVRVSTRTSSGNQIDTDCINVAITI